MKIAIINETRAADRNSDIMPALEYPGFIDLVEVASIQNEGLKQAFLKRAG